jgi:ArsR family transcriptional regulator
MKIIPGTVNAEADLDAPEAVEALAALAQPTRLAIYRLLVQSGPQGLHAGAIAEQLSLAPATLSFHVAQLARAGLARARAEGRFVVYTADFSRMNALVGFLTENCCGGEPCAPLAVPVVLKSPSRRRVPQ